MFLLNLSLIFLHTYLQLVPDCDCPWISFIHYVWNWNQNPHPTYRTPVCLGSAILANHICIPITHVLQASTVHSVIPALPEHNSLPIPISNFCMISWTQPGLYISCRDKHPIIGAAKSLQSCPTLRDPIDGSPPGSPIPGILQARTLEWVAISFSNARKWKVKVKSLSRIRLFATPWTAAYQAPPSMGFSRQEYWSGVPLPSPQ